MKNLWLIIPLLGLVCFVQSCKKELKFMDCKSAYVTDSSQMASKLVGTWKWSAQWSPWTNKTTGPDADVIVKFTAGEVTVTENSVVKSQGTWKLRHESGAYYLQSDSSLSYLGGEIMMCGDKVSFSTAYVDGPAFEFIRQ